MKKFTPIAMKCTQEDWESIKYKIPNYMFCNNLNENFGWYYLTNDFSETKKIAFTIKNSLKRKIYETFNAEIFLNACGIDCQEVVKSENKTYDSCVGNSSDFEKLRHIQNEKPIHYQTENNIDIIDFCKMYNLNFNRGNVIKYVSRAGKKDDELKDLEKALDFIQREIKYLKEK